MSLVGSVLLSGLLVLLLRDRTADVDGLGVSDKSLGLRDLPDGGSKGLQSLFGEELYGGGLPEVCHVESGTYLGVSCGGQDVVGTGCVVTCSDGSVGSDEDGSCVPDLGECVQRIPGDDA